MRKDIFTAILAIGFYLVVFAHAHNTPINSADVNTKVDHVEKELRSFLKKSDIRARATIVDYCKFTSAMLRSVCKSFAAKLAGGYEYSLNFNENEELKCEDIGISWAKPESWNHETDGTAVVPVIQCPKVEGYKTDPGTNNVESAIHINFGVLGFGTTTDAFLLTNTPNENCGPEDSGKTKHKDGGSGLQTPLLADQGEGSSRATKYYIDNDRRRTNPEYFPITSQNANAGTYKETTMLPYAILHFEINEIYAIRALYPRAVYEPPSDMWVHP